MPILHWLNKEQAITTAKNCAYRLLEEVPELSYGDTDNDNLLIQGDNLEALKALIPFYAGKVKCIYIDPPFNTGQAFDHYDDNLEHSIWLGMMFPRLELLHQLLAEDGTIVVHLDSEELAYAIVIMDEIFGRKNRISLCTFKQSSVSGPKTVNPGVISTSSYLFCYSKNKSRWKSYKSYKARERDSRYSKFIKNRKKNPNEWKITSLNIALEEHFGKSIEELKKKFNVNFEKKIEKFVLENRNSVIRTARVKPKDISEDARPALLNSEKFPDKFFEVKRKGLTSQFFCNGEQVAFYSNKVQLVNGEFSTAERVSDLWDDLLSNNLHKEGEVTFPKGKKPEALIRRVFELFSVTGDLVLDSFLGSGTTAAVAHKMKRKYIGIEVGEQAETHCLKRLQVVTKGDKSGVSKAENWQGGGGFKFVRLGHTVFDEYGCLNKDIKFPTLAAHIWYLETKQTMTKNEPSAFLGLHGETAFYLLYNGILGDRRPDGGNVLTSKVIKALPAFDEHRKQDRTIVVYGESTRLGEARLRQENIVFKQIPYDVGAL